MSAGRLLLRLLRFRARLFAFDVVFMSGNMLLAMAPGLLSREYFNLLTGSAPVRLGVSAMAVLIIMAAAARFANSFTLGLAHLPFLYETGGLLRKNLLARILESPVPSGRSPGEAVSRFRDDVDELTMSYLWFSDVFAFGLFTLVGLGVMLRINASVTLWACLPMALVAILANRTGRRVAAYHAANREASGEVAGFLGEILGGVQAVQAAGAEDSAVLHFERLCERRRAACVRDRLFREILDALFYNTVNLGIGLIMILVSRAMRAGSFTIGDFALFVYYLGYMTEFTARMGALVARCRQMGVSVKRMTALLPDGQAARLVEHGPVYLQGPLPEMHPILKTEGHRLEALEARDLTYRHPGSGRGIEGISFTVKRGQLVVIAGRVGSGKSTLLRVLTGLLPPDSGTILWNGLPISGLAEWMVPPRCGYAPQVPRLFSESLRDNILLGLPEAGFGLNGALHAAVLEEDIARMPDGFDTRIGPRGVRLSGGQARRVSIARMLVRDTELLVCDDLSGALDIETERFLWERLLARPGTTCLAVSHSRLVLSRADSVIVLKDGRTEAAGPLEALMDTSEEMRLIWRGKLNPDDPGGG